MSKTYAAARSAVSALAIATLTLTASTAAIAQDVWNRNDINMRTLLEYGFTIVDTNFLIVTATQQPAEMEVIYLQKDDKVFRCFTFEPQGQAEKHWCENLQ